MPSPVSVIIGGFDATNLTSDFNKMNSFLDLVAARVVELCPTDLELYWFLIRQAALLALGASAEQAALEASGLHRVEYDGRGGRHHDVEAGRTACKYVDQVVMPGVAARYGDDIAALLRAILFAKIHGPSVAVTTPVRKRFALMEMKRCSTARDDTTGREWADAIVTIEARLDRIAKGLSAFD